MDGLDAEVVGLGTSYIFEPLVISADSSPGITAYSIELQIFS
jgi:hypothetical protein